MSPTQTSNKYKEIIFLHIYFTKITKIEYCDEQNCTVKLIQSVQPVKYHQITLLIIYQFIKAIFLIIRPFIGY